MKPRSGHQWRLMTGVGLSESHRQFVQPTGGEVGQTEAAEEGNRSAKRCRADAPSIIDILGNLSPNFFRIGDLSHHLRMRELRFAPLLKPRFAGAIRDAHTHDAIHLGLTKATTLSADTGAV